MRKIFTITFAAMISALFATGFTACHKRGNTLADDTDTLAYIIGMNVGYNLLQLDSTLNIDILCAAIRDTYRGTPKMTMDEARFHYLREMNYTKYEKFKTYEERFLNDISKKDRSFVRTRTGVTYRVSASGDQQTLASNSRDTVVIRYRLSLQDGTLVESSFDKADTLKCALAGLVEGLQEVLKVVGSGGHADAWIPSDLAYGVAGDDQLGISGNSTLYYEVDVIDVIPYRRR